MNTLHDYPPEIIGFHLIEIASQTDTVILTCDERGSVQWYNKNDIHSWARLVVLLNDMGIPRVFDLGGTNNLNILFEKLPENNPLRTTTNHLEAAQNWPIYWYKECPSYQSIPGVADTAVVPFFITIWPLLQLKILRISESRFLCIITFRNIMKWLLQNENKIIVFCDSHTRIVGCTALFVEPMGIAEPKTILGKKLDDIMKFPLTAQHRTDDEQPSRLALRWPDNDIRIPFLTENIGQGKLSSEHNGLSWTNTDSDKYSFLEIPASIMIDNAPIDIEFSYSSKNFSFPTIILRGNKIEDYVDPDTLGYALTATRSEKKIRFRKSCVNVRIMDTPKINQSLTKVKIAKRGYDWQFFLNDEIIGEYTEHVPFSMKSANRTYFFLRPGESVILHSLLIRTGSPVRRNHAADEIQTAYYIKNPEAIQYHAKIEDGVFGSENYTLYEFYDVTPFLKSIKRLEAERERLGRLIAGNTKFIGHSEKIVSIREEASRTAPSNLSILIEGETGTGKEVLAKFIHAGSNCAEGPFVRIDCASLPETLLESELFGHEAGAFTGAVNSRPGLFEKAQGGTVFLDEVGNLPLTAQAKLLGVLESGEIQRLGGRTTIKVRFRLISASNEPFGMLLKTRRLREDLYFRLNQHIFSLPPLRERREDIPLFVNYFIEMACTANRKEEVKANSDAMTALTSYNWPGNIRELRNLIYKCVVLNNTGIITVGELGLQKETEPATTTVQPVSAGRKTSRRMIIGKNELEKIITLTGGNIVFAAEKLGISRSKLYKLVEQHGINLHAFREEKNA